jgi:histidinol-phosphate phosphatase family protein
MTSNGETARRRAVFLDRDGTINVDTNYLRDPDEFQLIPGVGEAIKALNNAGWLVIVITDQSGIGRGWLTEETLNSIHQRMAEALAAHDAHVDAIYHCPHTPYDRCTCRKPSPEMVIRAARDHNIDLKSSWFVGDKARDVETGRRAGCRPALVLTGFGQGELASAGKPDVVAEDLYRAVQTILGEGI